MLEDIAEKIVRQQIRYPKLFMLVFLIISLLMIPGILRLIGNVEPSLEKVLPQDVEEVKAMNDMRTQFGADMMYLIVFADGPLFDVRHPEMVRYIDLLSQKLRQRENIIEVNSIADIVLFKNNGVIPDSLIDTKELLDGSSGLMNDDFSFTVIMIRTDTGASAQTIKTVVNSINDDINSLEELNPGARIELTGFNAIDKATFEIIMSDFAVITAVSMVLIMIVVLLTFRSFAKGMLPMVVVMVALLWTMGVVGYLGLTITVVSMVSAAMILGLGIDFGIHIVHSYFENRKEFEPKKAMIETQRELLRATVAASLTTISGFLALLFGVLPAMKNLGVILALGILFTLTGAVMLLPVLIYLYDNK